MKADKGSLPDVNVKLGSFIGGYGGGSGGGYGGGSGGRRFQILG